MTGGAGFIGSHTVELLLESGAEVLVVDDLSHPCPEPPRVAMLTADCGSPDAAEAIARFGPDAVLHLASKGGVHRAARDPGAHVRASLASTVALFDAAVRAGARRIVTASSGGTVYGDATRLPASEATPPAPVSAYGAAKLAEENYLRMFGRRHDVSTLAMRYANVYGPRQDGTGEAGLVAITCHRLLEGRPPVIFGKGDQTRDFTYVEDVARANVSALYSQRSGVVNVGTGRESSVNEVVRTLIEQSGREIAAEHLPAREGEVRRVSLDPERAERWLGWKAKVSESNGLEATWSWFSRSHTPTPQHIEVRDQ